MNKPLSLLVLTPTPEERQDLVDEAKLAGFDVLARSARIDPQMPASAYDIIVYDWADGLPGDCANKVERFLDAPDRKASVAALVHRPNAGHRCRLFQHLDDIIFPPYDAEEVVARLIRLAERRTEKSEVLTAEQISVDLAGHEVLVNSERVLLTHTEFLVLAHLLTHRGRVVTRPELGRAVWGHVATPNPEALDVHVRRMRGKLRTAGVNPVETVRKVGYRYAG